MKRYNIICINCLKKGHTFKYCIYPIISYGILAYKKQNDELKYLLVQRKDTIGYIDFIRGKYPYDNTGMKLKILFSEMTYTEKYRILTLSFDKLWWDLWNDRQSRVFLNEYTLAKTKYEKLDIMNLVLDNLENSKWEDSEFCIPKGRRNNLENMIECAIREFCEETGYNMHDLKIKNNGKYVEEYFIGSNGISYKHIYYIAEINTNKDIPKIDENNVNQVGEIKAVKWFNYKDTMNIFRNYESTKRSIIFKINKSINNLI